MLTQQKRRLLSQPPYLDSRWPVPSAVLHPERLVAAAAFLADRGETRLERVEILDLALGLGDDLGEACDLCVEAGLVLPDFWRGRVVALGLHALGAGRKQVRQLL